eukprot:gene64484-88202_t
MLPAEVLGDPGEIGGGSNAIMGSPLSRAAVDDVVRRWMPIPDLGPIGPLVEGLFFFSTAERKNGASTVISTNGSDLSYDDLCGELRRRVRLRLLLFLAEIGRHFRAKLALGGEIGDGFAQAEP